MANDPVTMSSQKHLPNTVFVLPNGLRIMFYQFLVAFLLTLNREWMSWPESPSTFWAQLETKLHFAPLFIP